MYPNDPPSSAPNFETPEAVPGAPLGDATGEDVSRPATAKPPLRTRAGMAWLGVCAASLVAVALIVFMAQNTQRVEVSFLWMDTSTSLALTLLIATVAGVLVTLVVGTARIVQLRRAVRRHHR